MCRPICDHHHYYQSMSILRPVNVLTGPTCVQQQTRFWLFKYFFLSLFTGSLLPVIYHMITHTGHLRIGIMISLLLLLLLLLIYLILILSLCIF